MERRGLWGGGVALATLLTLGCGGGQTEHVLFTGSNVGVTAGTCYTVASATAVPASTMSFTIQDTPTNYPIVVGTDEMQVGIFPHGVLQPSSLTCDFSQAVLQELDGASAWGDSGPAPAGDYDLAVSCNNLETSCAFTLTWSASY